MPAVRASRVQAPSAGTSVTMASNSIAAHVLMKKGKRGAAAYIHADCSGTATPNHLNELLDLLLNPRKAIDEWETIDWCKWLMAGGRTPDEYSGIGECRFFFIGYVTHFLFKLEYLG